MNKVMLDGKWRLENTKGEKWEAAVPGCVHSDIFEDLQKLYYRNNNEAAKWIENEDWTYQREFILDETEGAYIVFEGLDTYCDIEINGNKVAYCDNMFIKHSIFAEPFLKKGENSIKVKFYSPVKAVEGREKLEGAFTTERLHSRRMQCTYGWDWVERFVTCGIFRPVYIEYRNEIYCENTYIYTSSIDSYGAEISVIAEFDEYENGGPAEFEIISPCGQLEYKKSVYIDMKQYKLNISIENPVLWDISEDNNKMYILRVVTGNAIMQQQFGIRTLRVLEKKDDEDSDAYKLCKKLQDTESGIKYDRNTEFSSFEVILNGRSVLCMGANWVPCEPFISEETEEKITRILTMSKDMGVNVIRVWGGGIFECEHFYNECDRLGIMVIQDFLMACGQYPEKEKWFIEALRKEADYASKRLRNHPSLIWWNGDNENAVNGCDSDEDFKGRSASLHGVLPVITKNDFMRPFFVSSPYGGTPNASKTCGTTHNTQFLRSLFNYIDGDSDGNDYIEYMKEYTARFVAEEPCFGASSYESLKNFMTESDIFEDDEMWLYHTKGNPSLDDEIYNYIKRFAEKIFGKFENGHDKLFKLQYLQYEWIRITMENTRRNRGFSNGEIYWMLNDCWPSAAGWSLIDYYTRQKSGFYAFKKAAEEFILSLDRSDDKLWVYLCNEGSEEKETDIKIRKINIYSGECEECGSVKISCSSGKSVRTEAGITSCDTSHVIIAEAEGKRAFYKFGGAKIKACEAPEILSCENGILRIKSDKYIHAVELFGGLVYEDNFFNMLPQEEKQIVFDGNSSEVKIKAYNFI